MNSNFEIIPATLEDYPTIQNLARFYAYDLSRSCAFISDDWNFPENGLYESFDTKIYFEDPTKKVLVSFSADFFSTLKEVPYPISEFPLNRG